MYHNEIGAVDSVEAARSQRSRKFPGFQGPSLPNGASTQWVCTQNGTSLYTFDIAVSIPGQLPFYLRPEKKEGK